LSLRRRFTKRYRPKTTITEFNSFFNNSSNKMLLKCLKALISRPKVIESNMKYLIVGLGNMGRDYEGTRHNIGFDVVDALSKEFDAQFEQEKLGDLASFKTRGKAVYLLKPSTFMNLSGKAVNHWVQKLKIKRENLLVVVDDLHLDFGTIRLKPKGSHAGHNGLKDIEKYVGNNQYNRLRVGIGDNFRPGGQSDFVLGEWSNKEATELPEILGKSKEMVKSFVAHGLKNTMNNFNNK